MQPIKVFISYSHQDAWLFNELITHLSTLRRNGVIDEWYDRKITPGSLFDSEIETNLRSSHIILLLVSPAFIASDYCIETEYKLASQMRTNGEITIVPVIVRACDWGVNDLKQLLALPTDGVPVFKEHQDRDKPEARDAAWVQVIEGLKRVVVDQKKKLTAPPLDPEYLSGLFESDGSLHPNGQTDFDELDLAVPLDLYHDNTEGDSEARYIASHEELADFSEKNKVVLIVGGDRSGKTLLAKRLQVCLSERGMPAVLLNGSALKHADLKSIIKKHIDFQFGETTYPHNKFALIIDDIEECRLSDRTMEMFAEIMSRDYARCILTSYSNAQAVLFTPEELPAPAVLNITELADYKILDIVGKWKRLGVRFENEVADVDVLSAFEKIQIIFHQTELYKGPGSVMTFLELLHSSSGQDLALSSFASCYDSLLHSRLIKQGDLAVSVDESRNFLALIAYEAYIGENEDQISKKKFDDCLVSFTEQYFSSADRLRDMAIGGFLRETTDGYEFIEDYLYYFLCARYVAKTLRINNPNSYRDFVRGCTSNIFQKKFANIVIYIAYFNDDTEVITSLLGTIDTLFSSADDWLLSDKDKLVMHGITSPDGFQVSHSSDVSTQRMTLLGPKTFDIIENAQAVVARYTLPFLAPQINDSAMPLCLSGDMTTVDSESYLASVNALLRIHSVLGQIFGARPGTYTANLLLNCIRRMVQASGRYAALNRAIALLLTYDKERYTQELADSSDIDGVIADDKYNKILRLFSFWSMYMSQAGLARYLNQPHSVRALENLAKEYETAPPAPGAPIPFNFTSVLIIAKLYQDGSFDKKIISSAVEKYGTDSALMSIIRAAVHLYSHYMPLSVEDKQWIASQLGIPLKRLQVQHFRKKLAHKKAGFNLPLHREDKSKKK